MGARASSLLKRVLSAAVMLPLILIPLFRGGWWFFGLTLIVVTVATCEYVRMLRHLQYRPRYVFAIGAAWAVLLEFYRPGLGVLAPVLGLLLVASLSWHVLRDDSSTPIENWLLPLGGALYIAWAMGHLIGLRALTQGVHRSIVVIGITAMADAGALFVGRTWGRRLLSPRLSPKKTWEGMLGGVAVALIVGPILTDLGGWGWAHGLALGLLLSTLAPLGDLGVSMVKRQVGVKDTSNLIPGHGGVFDRVDSVLVAAIVGYYYHVWVMGASRLG